MSMFSFKALRPLKYYIWLAGVLAAGIILYLPTLSHPPRSDTWSILYFFHSLSHKGPFAWLHIMNFDPFTQVRFYPLCHFIIYIPFLLFGAHYVCVHILNILIFSGVVFTIYRLARTVTDNKMLIFAGLTLYVFLYTHFDVLAWPQHIYIVFGFLCMLSGFVVFIKYLQTGSRLMAVLSAFLFLPGMLCYESFVFWPIAVFILARLKNIRRRRRISKRQVARVCLFVVAVVYSVYILIFFLSRSVNTYEGPLLSVNGLFSLTQILKSICGSLFNILYDNISVNLNPFLAWPPRIYDDVFEMAGVIPRFESIIPMIIFCAGVLMAISLTLISSSLLKNRFKHVWGVGAFFFYLMFSELFVLYHLRSLTNPAIFNLLQFRYQFIPNAFVILIGIVLADTAMRSWNKGARKIFYIVFAAVLSANVYCSARSIAFLNAQLRPLQRMLADVAVGIDAGRISEQNKLYIDDEIVHYLPPLCWNFRMGQAYMKGTYQWMFTVRQQACFSAGESQAAWNIDKNTLLVKRCDR